MASSESPIDSSPLSIATGESANFAGPLALVQTSYSSCNCWQTFRIISSELGNTSGVILRELPGTSGWQSSCQDAQPACQKLQNPSSCHPTSRPIEQC